MFEAADMAGNTAANASTDSLVGEERSSKFERPANSVPSRKPFGASSTSGGNLKPEAMDSFVRASRGSCGASAVHTNQISDQKRQ